MTLRLGFFLGGRDLIHGILGKHFLLLLFLLLLLGVLRVLGRLLAGLDTHVGHGPLRELDASPFFRLSRISCACFFRLFSGRIIRKYIRANSTTSMRIVEVV